MNSRCEPNMPCSRRRDGLLGEPRVLCHILDSDGGEVSSGVSEEGGDVVVVVVGGGTAEDDECVVVVLVAMLVVAWEGGTRDVKTDVKMI